MANGIAITRQEFDRSYANYDPRAFSRSGKIIGFHSGTINVNSFEGYTPDDPTQQFGYILGESPTDASTFALRKSAGNKPRFVYETEITNGDFLSHDKKPTKEQLKKIGVVNGVDFTNWKGEGSVFDAVAKTFGDWDSVDWNDTKFYELYNKGKQSAAKVLQGKGFVGNKYEADGLGVQYEVYDSADIKIKNKYQLYNSDSELIADQYHKVKANDSNAELVRTIESILGGLEGGILEQNEGQVKGATSLDEGITAYTAAADVSTLIHEPAHNLLGLIDELAKDGNKPAIDAQKNIEAHVKKEGQAFFDRSKQAGESWAKGEYNPNDPTMRQELFARSADKYYTEGAMVTVEI